jgi:hypothetical protein
MKANMADAKPTPGQASRRERTAFSQLRERAEHRRRSANVFVVASLIGIVALAVGLALLAR